MPILLLGFAALPAAHADTVLYSTGFEPPTFSVGPIDGQDGWSTFSRANSASDRSLATVTSGFAQAGTRSVFISGAVSDQTGPFHTDPTAGPLIDLSADFAVFTSTNETEWQFAGLGPGLSGFLGGIDIFSSGTGNLSNIEAITAGFPVIGTFARATAFDSTAWHHIDLLFNITTQKYNVSLDGISLATGLAFCGDNNACGGAPVSSYGNGIFDSLGAVTNGNDSGYMDNYRVATENPVPEPANISLLLVALVGLGVLARRKFFA